MPGPCSNPSCDEGGVVPILAPEGRRLYCAACVARLSGAGGLANCFRCNTLFIVGEETIALHADHAVTYRREDVIGHATARHYAVLGTSPAWLGHMAENGIRAEAPSGLVAIMWGRGDSA